MKDEEFLESCSKGIKKLLEVEGECTASHITQYSLFCHCKGKNVASAKAFMARVATLGFGEVRKTGKRGSLLFRKRKRDDLPEDLGQYLREKSIKYD